MQSVIVKICFNPKEPKLDLVYWPDGSTAISEWLRPLIASIDVCESNIMYSSFFDWFADYDTGPSCISA